MGRKLDQRQENKTDLFPYSDCQKQNRWSLFYRYIPCYIIPRSLSKLYIFTRHEVEWFGIDLDTFYWITPDKSIFSLFPSLLTVGISLYIIFFLYRWIHVFYIL